MKKACLPFLSCTFPLKFLLYISAVGLGRFGLSWSESFAYKEEGSQSGPWEVTDWHTWCCDRTQPVGSPTAATETGSMNHIDDSEMTKITPPHPQNVPMLILVICIFFLSFVLLCSLNYLDSGIPTELKRTNAHVTH